MVDKLLVDVERPFHPSQAKFRGFHVNSES